jgi:multidrug efflux pump subunit AcrA (membrane-fusion protein)
MFSNHTISGSLLDLGIDGIVLEGLIEPGEVTSPGTPLFALAQLNDLAITVFIPEDRRGE